MKWIIPMISSKNNYFKFGNLVSRNGVNCRQLMNKCLFKHVVGRKRGKDAYLLMVNRRMKMSRQKSAVHAGCLIGYPIISHPADPHGRVACRTALAASRHQNQQSTKSLAITAGWFRGLN